MKEPFQNFRNNYALVLHYLLQLLAKTLQIYLELLAIYTANNITKAHSASTAKILQDKIAKIKKLS